MVNRGSDLFERLSGYYCTPKSRRDISSDNSDKYSFYSSPAIKRAFGYITQSAIKKRYSIRRRMQDDGLDVSAIR